MRHFFETTTLQGNKLVSINPDNIAYLEEINNGTRICFSSELYLDVKDTWDFLVENIAEDIAIMRNKQ